MCKNYNLAEIIHPWDLKGYVKLSDDVRKKLEKIIKQYGLKKLSRELTFDKETIYSIYNKGRKEGIHSIYHLSAIISFLKISPKMIETKITHYGCSQNNMYKISFPFFLTPLHLRAVTIHGDGSFYYKPARKTMKTEWYQSGDKIKFMEKLLKKINGERSIKSRKKCRENNVNSITIPCYLLKIVCKSLNLKLERFFSIDFFKRVSQLPNEFKVQVLFQFLVDESHLKGTTLTVSQHKKDIRNGFKILLNSLDLSFSNPSDEKQDITIYNYNFPKIFHYLKTSKELYGKIGGLWFKEKEFIKAFKKS